MYQWQDPVTGTTHFSGNPPAWYRSNESGPRVLVFEKGRIIDDTNIRLSEESSNELRLQAIARAEEDREIARQKAMAAEEMKTRMKSSETEDLMQPESPADQGATGSETDEIVLQEPGAETGTSQGVDGLTSDEMRALILQWELEKTQQAKREISNNGQK